ncbi:MAG: shikimate dehydrogenase family protein [Candidatus Cryptobacteroides sp.]
MKFGLIGDPIAHSLSPALFKAGYDGRWAYELIEGSDFEASFKRFMDEYQGINVTAPFKEAAFAKADILSEECRLIGAANILVKTSCGVLACNSDFLGVRRWLQEVGAGDGSSVLIAGCGGAGKAAAFASATLGCKTVLMNRDRSKAEKIASKSEGDFRFEVADLCDFRKHLKHSDIIIYNIPSSIPSLEEMESTDLLKGAVVLEANYRNPSFSGRIRDVLDEAGADYVGGKLWLLYQAVTGYKIFTGEEPDLAKMSACL